MFGLRQSGDLGLILADIYEDIDILKCARFEANNLIKSEERRCKLMQEYIEIN